MSLAFIIVVVVVVTVTTPVAATTNRQNVNVEIIPYLQKYGYLKNVENNTQSSIDSEEVKQAISLFQEYYQIPGDGTLNDHTLSQMRKPRCGLPDIPHEQNEGTIKWPKTHLTWNFHLADAATLQTTAFAFSLWAAHSSLSFERKVLNPDILISYRSGAHTFTDRRRNEEICSSSFDGRGGVLAHAFYPSHVPNYVAEIHMDNTEPWHIYLNEKPADKEYLVHTLTHEIGHALGLPHSSREDSIMFAYTSKNQNATVKLIIEDILAIQQLYGTNNLKPTTTTTPPITIHPSPTEIPTNKPKYVDICNLQNIDTVLILYQRMYITQRRYVWSININTKKHDGPFTLNSYMNFLPENFTLTAAYQRPTGEIVLFVNNNMVYMVDYPNFKLKAGWPRRLSNLGFPTNVLLNAVVNTNRGQTYAIFNDHDVAEIDECNMSVRGYHTLQSIFPGIPPAPTFVFRHIDGNIYFVNKQQFYKFNEFTKLVTEAGKFTVNVLNVECSRDGLLQQLQDILNRLIRST